MDIAGIILGLDHNQKWELFTPVPSRAGSAGFSYDALPGSRRPVISPAHAAQTLRRLADTGEVDWSTA